MKKILVTTDGSVNSEKALLEAKKLAQLMGAEVDILNVVKYIVNNPYAKVERYSMRPVEDLEKAAKGIVDDALKLFDDFDGKVSAKFLRGEPAEVIVKEAEEGAYDLLVIGSRGLGTFSRLMLGSVSGKVVNHVHINVLIVK